MNSVCASEARFFSSLDGQRRKVIFSCPSSCTHPSDLGACGVCMAACLCQLRSGRPVSRIVIAGSLSVATYREEDSALLVEVAMVLEYGRLKARNLLRRTQACPYDRRSVCVVRFGQRLRDLFAERLGLLFTDPVMGYLRLLWLEEELKAEIHLDKGCRECLTDYLRFVSDFESRLKHTSLIRKLEGTNLASCLFSREAVYSRILNPLRLSPRMPRRKPSELGISKTLDRYIVPPYEVSIQGISAPPGTVLYAARPSLADARVLGLVSWLDHRIRESALSSGTLTGSLDDLIRARLEVGRHFVCNRRVRFSPDEEDKVVRLAVYRSLSLNSLMPLLLDENVEEIFMDAPGTPLYLDHRDWGRCVTRMTLSPREVVALKTRLRSESGMRLDMLNPSLKAEVSTPDFLCRFSVDVQPLANDGFSLDIRKLRKRHFTLPELIANGTLSAEAAAYLYFCLGRSRNITVIGEPNSGKTTLINALDLLTPASWRKITVEDVVESIPQWLSGAHQVRLKVAPIESRSGESESKSVEIVKLLHRAPDWIYLGEIQTAEHSRAMFHALSAGLRGLQTCHAGSPEQALRRWVVHHGVSPVCLLDLDVLVQLARISGKGREMRRVVRVCEVKGITRVRKDVTMVDLGKCAVQLCSVFGWTPESSSLRCVSDLFQTPVLMKIKEIESLDSTSFGSELAFYKGLFERLSFLRIFDVESNVKIFQTLSDEKREQEKVGGVSWDVLSARFSRLVRQAIA